MKKIISIISILIVGFAYGQTTVKKSCISTSGGSHINGNVSLTYTVGEVAIQEKTQGNIQLSEGFITPDIYTTTGIEAYGELYGIQIYPNPVQTDLQIKLPAYQTFEIYLFDLNGKKITGTQTDKTIYSLNLTDLPASIYMLIIVDRNYKQYKSFKINKL